MGGTQAISRSALPLFVILLAACNDKPEREPKATALEARVAALEDAGRRPGAELDASAPTTGRCSEDGVRAAAQEGRSADVKQCILPRLRPPTSDELRLLKAACTIPLDQPCLDEIRRAETPKTSDPLRSGIVF